MIDSCISTSQPSYYLFIVVVHDNGDIFDGSRGPTRLPPMATVHDRAWLLPPPPLSFHPPPPSLRKKENTANKQQHFPFVSLSDETEIEKTQKRSIKTSASKASIPSLFFFSPGHPCTRSHVKIRFGKDVGTASGKRPELVFGVLFLTCRHRCCVRSGHSETVCAPSFRRWRSSPVVYRGKLGFDGTCSGSRSPKLKG